MAGTSPRALALTLMLVTLAGCREQRAAAPPVEPIAAEDIERAPPVTDADRPHAGVFRSLDGVWEGVFTVYADERGQQEGPRPTAVDPAALASPPYHKELELQVRQEYVSESDFFQRVQIRDTYADGRVEVSRGVNKVQDGELLCVVKKPGDRVVHSGSTPSSDTIVWQRSRAEPQAIEWLRETVARDTYSIVGWGYYPGDDPTKTPRLFFHATYRRVD